MPDKAPPTVNRDKWNNVYKYNISHRIATTLRDKHQQNLSENKLNIIDNRLLTDEKNEILEHHLQKKLKRWVVMFQCNPILWYGKWWCEHTSSLPSSSSSWSYEAIQKHLNYPSKYGNKSQAGDKISFLKFLKQGVTTKILSPEKNKWLELVESHKNLTFTDDCPDAVWSDGSMKYNSSSRKDDSVHLSRTAITLSSLSLGRKRQEDRDGNRRGNGCDYQYNYGYCLSGLSPILNGFV